MLTSFRSQMTVSISLITCLSALKYNLYINAMLHLYLQLYTFAPNKKQKKKHKELLHWLIKVQTMCRKSSYALRVNFSYLY